jgi:hypothetical protein
MRIEMELMYSSTTGPQQGKRELPERTIEGTVFVVDVAYAELWQKDAPLNSISFYDLEFRNGHYILPYNRGHKNIHSFYHDPSGYALVELPQMVDLDREGMALKYGLSPDTLPKYDHEFKCREDLFEQRLKSVLPQIVIYKQTYEVEWAKRRLRCIENDLKSINLSRTDMSPHGRKYVCFYNMVSGVPVQIKETLTELPKDVVMVLIPNELYLDSVAVARQYSESDRFLIDKYPIQPKMEARTISLDLTRLPKQILENKERLSTAKRLRKRSKGL